MSRRLSAVEGISDEFIAEVIARAAADERVWRKLPGGGRIHLDRRLPFLCVYRQPTGGEDPGTSQLITSEAANLAASADARWRKPIAVLVRRLSEALAAHFGGFLILEVWSEPEGQPGENGDFWEESRPPPMEAARDPRRKPESGPFFHGDEPVPPVPAFRIYAQNQAALQSTIDKLVGSLRTIKVHKQPADVVVDGRAGVHPPGMKPLMGPAEARRLGCWLVGLEVRPVYRDRATGQVFPGVLRLMRRRLGRALKQTFFTFARTHTRVRPQHYYSLGRRSVAKIVWEVDRRLAEIDHAFDLLLQATPVNVEAAWYEFKRQGFAKPPVFHYRPVAVEPALLKRQLYEIPVERIEDPTLADIFREKQDELDRRITMLSDLGTPRFLLGSLQVYGGVDAPLLTLAGQVLENVRPRSREDSQGRQLDAKTFAALAGEEIARYRNRDPRFTATVSVRDDLYSGLLVSQGQLLVGRKTSIPAGRVEALLQHEIGTHLVTYYNGRAQPLRQLASGFAGYDGLQEGLAVLSEYLVGGLSRPRMRLLAARVVAAHQRAQGASFVDTFHLLARTYQFSQRAAYTITMRICRGGGLTKDVVYLRGLMQILDYLRRGGEIEPLWLGKIAADHVPLVRELRFRQVLHPSPLRPRYMEYPHTLEKLARLRQGLSVLQLIEVRSHEDRIRRQ